MLQDQKYDSGQQAHVEGQSRDPVETQVTNTGTVGRSPSVQALV